MKKHYPFRLHIRSFSIAFILFITLSANGFSQNYHVVDTLMQNPLLMGGVESPYRFIHYPSTPAPKGYKAFYIGHYGRHGSRYGWDSKMYTLIHDVFNRANKENVLTPKGLDFWNKYKEFYLLPYINTGDLTPLGWQQHKRIANELARQYPEIFNKKAQVEAHASSSGRAILSMGAFLVGLKEVCPQIQVEGDALHQNGLITSTKYAPEALKQTFKADNIPNKMESAHAFSHRTIPYGQLLQELFTDTLYFDRIKVSRTTFLYQMFDFLLGYHNYCEQSLFDNIFTPQQFFSIWEARNYEIYLSHNNSCWQHIPVLRNVIDKAQLAIEGKGNTVDLRFGHDHVFNPFMKLLNTDGEQNTLTKVEDVKYWYQTYNTPMAATVLFVLYKNKKGDVLFKVTRNGREITLPQLTPVSGPYYQWNDFTTWANKIYQEHPLINSK